MTQDQHAMDELCPWCLVSWVYHLGHRMALQQESIGDVMSSVGIGVELASNVRCCVSEELNYKKIHVSKLMELKTLDWGRKVVVHRQLLSVGSMLSIIVHECILSFNLD